MTVRSASEATPRYDRQQALDLLLDLPMGELMHLAHAERKRRFPENVVTFVVDTNPNYTNVCVTGCAFCAFCRRATDEDAFLLSPDEVAERVDIAAAKGATTVLLQGGHKPKGRLADWFN